jgi:hypothetical protein
MKKQKFLTTLALVMAILILFLTGYTLLYIITNSQDVEERLRKQIQVEIAGIKVPVTISPKDGKNGDSIIGEKGDRGEMGLQGGQGVPGVQGPMGPMGPQGLQGERGFDGAQGLQGDQGTPGEQGTSGRTLEQRCVVVNETTRRIEQKYTDAEQWEVLYYLSPGQKCAQEVPA